MMNNGNDYLLTIVYFVLILIFISLVSYDKILMQDKEIDLDEKSADATIDSVYNEMVGVWGMTNYFDTIIKNKSVAGYRGQVLTWSTIIINIRNDSIFTYGSIFKNKTAFNYSVKNSLISDIIKFTDCNYRVKYDKPFIVATIIDSCFSKDTIKYVFRKRKDLDRLINLRDDVNTLKSEVTDYFNENILAGTYLSSVNNEKVVLGKNGQISGFKNFDKYRVGIYFGTFHPFNNLDVLILNDSSSEDEDYFTWKFTNNGLVLRPFITHPDGLDEFIVDKEEDYFFRSLTSVE